MNRSLFNWGIFFICLGGVPLLVDLGRLDANVGGDIWRLWPLILVGIGLGLVLRLTPLSWLGGALVAGTFGVMLGAAVSGSSGSFGGACAGPGSDTTSRSGLASDTNFELDMAITCGEVTVSRAAASRWVVEVQHDPDRVPVIEGTSDRLSLGPHDGGGNFLAFLDQERSAWDVTLPTAPALRVGMTLNAASSDLALGPGPVSSVGATLNFGDTTIDLGDASANAGISLGLTSNFSSATVALPDGTAVNGGITLNFSSLKLCLSPDAALRIAGQGTMSSDDYSSAGLQKVGDAWETPSYADSAARMDLELTSTFSSVSVDRSGGCS
jgi:hypothetical protein